MKEIRKIEVDLTDVEVAKLADQAAEYQATYFKENMKFEDYKKQEKKRLDHLKEIVIDLLRNIERRTKEVEMECDVKPDLVKKRINYFYNGKEVDSIEMTFDQFDSFVNKLCTKVVDEENYNIKCYQDGVFVIARKMTNEQIEKYEQEKKGQQTLSFQKGE